MNSIILIILSIRRLTKPAEKIYNLKILTSDRSQNFSKFINFWEAGLTSAGVEHLGLCVIK